VLQGPVAEPREQDVGRRACKIVSKTKHEKFQLGVRSTEEAPHEAGTAAERALKAVRKAA
jgi:hypothetical protein